MPAPHATAADTTERDTLPWHPPSPAPDEWSRVVLATLTPRIDGGRWPIQRSVGEEVEVVAGVIVDGHEKLAVELHWRHEDEDEAHVTPMPLRYNDEYVASFRAERLGYYRYKVRAWLDPFGTWQDQFHRRVEGAVVGARLADGDQRWHGRRTRRREAALRPACARPRRTGSAAAWPAAASQGHHPA